MRRDLISVVEAGYQLEPAEPEWLRGVLEAARRCSTRGSALIGWSFEQHGRVRSTRSASACPDGFGVAVEQAHQIISRRCGRAYAHPKLFATMQRAPGRTRHARLSPTCTS